MTTAVQAVKRVTKITLAMDYLREMLAEHGQIEATTIEEQARLAGHNAKAVKLAKQRLGVKSLKKGGRWWWTMKKANT